MHLAIHYMIDSGNMKYINIGTPTATTVVFAHGWGRSHHDFIPVAESIAPFANSFLLDLPGFGETPRPDDAWDTAEYANHAQEFLAGLGLQSVIWVGHSFGGRIGLRLAVNSPDILSGLVLVASAGIPVQQSIQRKLHGRLQRYRFQSARRCAKDSDEIALLEQKYGSADYVHSAQIGLRDIFLKVIAEDQSAQVVNIRKPVRLVYGGNDFETPVSIGQKLQQLIPRAELVVCPEFNHFDILNRGRHQIAIMIKELIQSGDPSADSMGAARHD